jgi:hypothetical protein
MFLPDLGRKFKAYVRKTRLKTVKGSRAVYLSFVRLPRTIFRRRIANDLSFLGNLVQRLTPNYVCLHIFTQRFKVGHQLGAGRLSTQLAGAMAE